jgi:hypothetical protein
MADPTAQVEAHHFLGAVVYASRPPLAGDVTRHDVIDGQQRMTTLQLLIDAVQVVIDERGHDDMSEALEDLVLNSSRKYIGKRERFKLWPSQADRAAFEQAMDDELPSTGDHQILAAHRFFRHEAEQWLSASPTRTATCRPERRNYASRRSARHCRTGSCWSPSTSPVTTTHSSSSRR